MTIYHLKASSIGRSKGRSACAAAAYQSADKIKDERTGITFDYTHKSRVRYSEIIAPAGSPTWTINRAELWNHAEQAEENSTRRATATTAREFVIALPHELGCDDQLILTREFAQYIVTTYGVVVDFSIHEPSREGDNRNFHAHLMLTDRRITDAGFAGKLRELNIFNGGKMNIASIREQWAKIANRFLERARVLEFIDHRSYKSQCIDRVATIHLGVATTAMERRGVATERGDWNRTVLENNALRMKFEKVRETMLPSELAETYEDKARTEFEVAEKADKATIIELIDITHSTLKAQDVNAVSGKATNLGASSNAYCEERFSQRIEGIIDQEDMSRCPPDSHREETALSKLQKFGQIKDLETPKPSATKMTHEERIKEAEIKTKIARELRCKIDRDQPSLDRGRGR